MGIISRFTDIMKANTHAVLSRMEEANADKLLEQYIRETKDTLGQVKAETAAVMAEEMSVRRKMDTQEQEINKFHNYAVKAVESGNDNDARKFLSHKAELKVKMEDLTQQYELAKQNTEKMREMAKKLTDDLETYESKLKELKMKLNMAKQQEKLTGVQSKFGSGSLSKFDDMAETIQKRVDVAKAQMQLEKQLSQDDEIAALEKKYAEKSVQQNNHIVGELAALKVQFHQK